MSSFPELDNLIDTVLNQVQEEPLVEQPTSMDEGMDSRIIIGITTVGVIGAIAIGSFGLYRFKDQLLNWYRSVVDFIHEKTQ